MIAEDAKALYMKVEQEVLYVGAEAKTSTASSTSRVNAMHKGTGTHMLATMLVLSQACTRNTR